MKKILKGIFSVLLTITVLTASYKLYMKREIGAMPSPEELKSYEKLPYFKDGVFYNTEKKPFYIDKITNGPKKFTRLTFSSKFAPKKPIPQVKLTKDSFSSTPEDFAFYWLGHASLILELDAQRIIFDPVLENGHLIPFAIPRYAPSPISYKNFPPIDYVVITHNHSDHLERKSIQALKNSHFIVPLGVGAALRGWGVKQENITELGWGDSFEKNGITIVAEPTLHNSGRSKASHNKTLWNSYVLKGKNKKIYWSGDTGYSYRLKQIGQKHGPFDLAAIEIDAWNPGWPNVHLFPHQVRRAIQDLKVTQILPIHWGVFDAAFHPWHESIDIILEMSKNTEVDILLPMMGQKIIPNETQTKKWW